MKRSTIHAWLLWVFAAALACVASGSENEATIQRLQLAKFVPPEFPSVLRVEGVPSGMVALAISHDTEGRPTDVLVLESTHPAFTDAALAAVRQWRFPSQSPDAVLEEPPALVRMGFSLNGVVLTYSSMANRLAEHKADELDAPIVVKTAGEVTGKPRLLNQTMPAYPQSLAGRDLEGQAKVSFFVDEDGRVRLPHVVKATTPEFGDAAVAAVRNWRYEPPRDRGQPAVVSENWVFQFSKRGE